MKKFRENRLWIYFFPALMDLSVAAVLIFSAIRAVELGAQPFMVGILGSVWGITYFISSFILSKIVSRNNSAKLMRVSCTGFILIGLFFNFFNTLFLLFILLFMGGLFSAFFFVGFQLFMEHSTKMSAHRASGFYTLSWSSGMAVGSISEGFLMGKSAFVSQLPVFLPSIAIILGIRFFERLNNDVDSFENSDYSEIDDFLAETFTKIAWLEIFTVTFVSGGIRYLLPKMAISFFGFDQRLVATAVFLFFAFQALSGFVSLCFKSLRYNIFSHDTFKLFAGFSLIFAVLYPSGMAVFLLVCILGIYTGHAFYSAVLYAISHKKKAGFNVGINESLVGIASVGGPFFSGLMLNYGFAYFLIFPCFVLMVCSFLQHRILRISARHS